MTFKLLAAGAAGAAAIFGASASAASLSEQISLCKAAIADEGLVDVNDYRAEFVRVRGASAKRLTIELIPRSEGEEMTAECKIRRGEVQKVELES